MPYKTVKKEKKAPVPPVKKESRRLTNKEREAACAALIDYMMVVAMPKEETDILASVINKLRVKK